MGKDLD